jgi:hypothetical protein
MLDEGEGLKINTIEKAPTRIGLTKKKRKPFVT